MNIENEMINKKTPENKLDNEKLVISDKESSDREKKQADAAEENKQEFLKELGISLKSEEEMSRMSFSDIISYQKDMKDEILKVQTNLPLKILRQVGAYLTKLWKK